MIGSRGAPAAFLALDHPTRMKTLCVAIAGAVLALALAAIPAEAQETVLLQQVASRELTVSIGEVDPTSGQTVVSREVGIFVSQGPVVASRELDSREYDIVRVGNTPPPAISALLVTVSSTGTTATLDWSSYNQFLVGDIARFDIYLSDAGPITSLTGLTPYTSVLAGNAGAVLSGLAALTDHYFVVVPVDGLGHFTATVQYAAGYVLSPQAISRELGISIGAELPAPLHQAVSREIDLAVVGPMAPPPIAKLTVTTDAQGDTATLDWSSYNQYVVGDVSEFDIYYSDTGPITDVTGLTPFVRVNGNTNSVALTGLAVGRDHYFAVVAVNPLGNSNPLVNYAAGYVLLPQVISREYSLGIGSQPPGEALMAVSREFSVVAPTDAVPAPVTGAGSGFTAVTSASAFGAVDLDWTSYDEYSQRDVAAYQVYVQNGFFTDVTGLTPYATVQDGRQTHTVTGLNGAGIYYFAVVAVDALGQFNPAVRAASAQASIAGVGEVVNLAGSSTSNSITVTWTPPPNAGAFLRGYHLYVSGSATPVVLAASAISYTATGLQPATGYSFRVVTVDPFGTESAGATLLGATLLPNPSGVSLTALAGQVVMLWNGAQPAALVSGYEVYESSAPFSNIGSGTRVYSGALTNATLGSFAAVSGKSYAVVTVNILGSKDPAVTSIVATKRFQTINFTQPILAAGSLTTTLSATSDSGLPVRFAVSPADSAQIATGPPAVLTALRGGPVVVTANQDGNADYWPGDPVSYNLRLPPVITSFSANFTPIVDNSTLQAIDETLRVVALDANGLSQAEFFIQPSGSSAFTSLGVDTDPTDGLSANLALDAVAAGPADLKVVVQTPDGSTSQLVRHVTLQLGAPTPPTLTAPADGTQTSVATATVAGTAGRGTTVAIFRNGVQVAGPLTPTAGVFTASVALLPGANILTARATNGVGTSVDSASRTVTLLSALTLTATPDTLTEGDAGALKVARNHTHGAVVVTLTPSLAGQLTLPATVSIADGSMDASVRIVAIDNNVAEADRSVAINGTAGGYSAGSATVTVLDNDRKNLPDLVVTSVTAPAQALPGAQIEVDWVVKNQGVGPAAAGWTDQIFVSDDHVIGNDHLAGTLTAPAALAAGQSVNRSAQITVPAIGAGAKYLVVKANGGGEVFESNFSNNSAIAAVATTVQTVLTLQLSATSTPENGGALTATLVRNGDTTGPLNVALSATPAGNITLPSSVTIPANAASVAFPVQPIDDQLLNGNRTVTLTAHTAAGYGDGAAALQIIDDDVPMLTVTINPSSATETAANPAAMGTVQRNTPTTQPLTVGLVSSLVTAALAPATVTIPAGATSVNFPITVIDDLIVTDTRTVRFTASATGLATGSATFDVLDDDIPGLSLQLAPSGVSENASNPAASGHIVFTRAPVQDVLVALASSDTTLATTPASILVRAGSVSADFPIAVVNRTSSGTHDVTIMVAQTDSVLRQVIAGQSDQKTLHIYGSNGSTLTLSGPSTFAVGAATLTVGRQPGTSGAVTVALASDNAAVTVPATVVIPDGQASASVSAQGTTAGSATITASLNGYNSAALGVTVTASNLPDLIVDTVTLSKTSAISGETINIAWTVSNDGNAPAAGNWVDGVYLTTDRLSTTNTLSASAAITGPLASGAGYLANASVVVPTTPGRYWAVISADARNNVAEGSETNNLLVSTQPIDVGPAYNVTVSTTVTLAASGTPVPLTGQALKTVDGTPAANVPITVRVLVNGTRRVLTAITDNNGQYLTTFRPLPTEAGHYSLAAAQPEVTADVVQGQFELIGIGANPMALDARLAVQQPLTGFVTLTNLSDHPLSGLAGVVQSPAANVSGSLQVPAALPANGSVQLAYTITAADDTFTSAKIGFHVTSAEGATVDIPVQVSILSIGSQLVANPGALEHGMLRGVQTLVSCDLVNLGAAPTGDLSVELPALPWMTLASPAVISSLAPGAHATITLQLLPAANMPLQLYSGNLFVRAGQSGLSLPFAFRAISAAVGDVQINVLDDYTYYAPGAPRVAGATVRLRDAYDQSKIVAEGGTDATGAVVLPGAPEATYVLEVSAPQHSTYSNPFSVVAGILNSKDVFIDRQTVSYTWDVVPTEIPDRYDIKLVATFEADVPVPVVTMEPSISTLPDLADGESVEVDLTLTNQGLIAAEQISLSLPGPESGFQYIPLISQLDSIAAKSSIVIPMVVRRVVGGQTAALVRKAPRFAGGGGGGGGGGDCVGFCAAIYSYICGPDRKFHQAGCAIVTGLSCPGGAAGGGGFIPFGYAGAAGGGGIFPSITTSDDCDPCAAGNAKTLFDCIIGFIPGGEPAKCLYGIYNCINDTHSGNVTAPYGCFRTVQGCAGVGGGPLGSALDCAAGFYQNALDCKKASSQGGGSTHALVRKTISHYEVSRASTQALDFSPPSAASGTDQYAVLEERIGRVQDEVDAGTYAYGDAVWLHAQDNAAGAQWMAAYNLAIADSSDGGAQITATERAALLAQPLPPNVTVTQANTLFDRNNRTLTYYAAKIFNLTDVPANQSTDFFALDVAYQKFSRFNQSYQAGLADGFDSPDAGLIDALVQIQNQPEKKTQGVCAEVKIEIDQQAVLTRQAFSGTLEVTNGNPNNAISGVSVVLDIRDDAGNSANDKFFVTAPTVTGVADASGAGVIAAGATGRLQYTFIPTHAAAPTTPTVYQFTGTLQYNDGGQQVSVPLLPSPVRVYPDAQLVLKYFEQRDVYSDDPFTPQIEPAEPFSLGLLVTNVGGGSAKDFTITSAQPKIIDNQKGLLVDFKIIGTQVGAQTLAPSLTVDLGDLAPGDSQVAQFILTSSLQGKFIDYQASFEHSTDLGGLATSLISSVEIHELIHVVRADRAGDDALPDFLVNDVPDPNSLPDTLYLSDGSIAPVNVATDVSATIGTLQGQLTATMPSGWCYLEVADPGAGLKLARVVRSDGKVLRIGDNAWQTDRSFPNALTGALRQRLVHLFDFDGTGSYTLYYTTADTPGTILAPIQIAQLGPVTPAARSTPVDTVDVSFTRPIDPATFTAASLSLSLNGGANLIMGTGVTIAPLTETSYRIAGLAGFNAAEGTYILRVDASMIDDVTEAAGQGSASVVWAVSTSHLAVVSAGGFGGSTIRGPVASIDVVFSGAVNPASFTLDDLSFTLNGGANLLTASNTITQLTANSFRINGLTALTGTAGRYAFTVHGDTVTDSSGLAGVGQLTETFGIDNSGPTIQSLDAIAPNPRNTAISTLDLVFSKPIVPASFDATALKLTLNGKAISLGTTQIISLDATHFKLAGLAQATGAAGNYQLTVSAAAVQDTVGNLGSGVLTRTWQVALKQPRGPFNLAISPDTGLSATDGITNTTAISVKGSVGSGTARVRVTDTTSGSVLGQANVATTSFSVAVQLGTAGLHNLIVEALDAAGNVSIPSPLAVFVDLSPPTAAITPISPTPRQTPVASVEIKFSEALNPTTFTLAALSLTRDGIAVPLGRGVTIQTGAAGDFFVSGLSALTDPTGLYTLSVALSGIQDIAGNHGQGAASVTWRRAEGGTTVQFASLAGAYNGLIEADTPAHATSGIIAIALTRTGAFTASGKFGGAAFSFHGKLDGDGKFSGLFGKKAAALSLNLSLVMADGADSFVGSVSGKAGSANLLADRLLYSAANPTPLRGKYGVLLMGPSAGGSAAIPVGHGFAVLTVLPTGRLTAAGQFADGTKFTQSSALGGTDEWPFYAAMDGGRSSAIGAMTFRPIAELSDLDGTANWFRTARPKAASFPAAFATTLQVIGSAYPAESGEPPVLGAAGQTAELTLTGGGLPDAGIELPLTFGANGTAKFGDSGQLKLSLPNGQISGSIVIPGDKKATKFQGVAFPIQRGGAGSFIRVPNGGLFELKIVP